MVTAKEICRKISKVGVRLGMCFKHDETIEGLKGHVSIKAYEKGELVYDWASPNVIVNTASILVARLLKDSREPTGGITYLAVGTGDDNWDLQDPPAPTTNQVQLASELFRIPVTSSTFINPEDGSESTTATNVVDYAFNFQESDAVGPLVEMGIFGGDATNGRDTGTMVNYRTFPVLNKTNSMAFTIIIRITT